MDATPLDGYWAMPPQGAGRGVLVLHPWWGLNETVRLFCRILARAGFSVLAPDLYHGKLAATIPEAEALSNALDGAQAKADVARAAGVLAAHAVQGEAGLAVVGFSLGAYFALDLSVAQPNLVRAVVLYYGTGSGPFEAARALYLGHFAEADVYETAEQVAWLEGALLAAGRTVTFYRYAGTGHWFCEPDRTQAYNESAATLAWERTLAFLKRVL